STFIYEYSPVFRPRPAYGRMRFNRHLQKLRREHTMTEPTPQTRPEDDTKQDDAPQGRTFTQEELENIISKRLAREREKFERETSELVKKAQEADGSKSELQKLAEQMEQLRRENEENKVTAIRHMVASSKGVPADLLHGSSQDELERHADVLLEYVNSSKKPPSAPEKPGAPLKS